MSVVDLHPENLLDKEIRGELDDAERQRLEAHLAQCATCRLERELRADFALELSRDSVPPEIASLVDTLAKGTAGTVGAAGTAGTVEPAAPVARTAPSTRTRRMKLVFLAAAATLTLVAGAFAATEGDAAPSVPCSGGRDRR